MSQSVSLPSTIGHDVEAWWKSKKVIYVVGFPRSGTTWIARAIAHALDCPFLGAARRWTVPLPIDVEGLDRESEYVVRRTHHTVDGFYGRPEDHEIAAVIHAVRDPRDVALSAWRYFTYDKTQGGLDRAVNQLCGPGRDGAPLHPNAWRGKNRRGWPGYVEDWLDMAPTVAYEDHLKDPVGTLRDILFRIGFVNIPDAKIREAAEANLFKNRKKDKLMFRGKAGLWKQELEKRHIEKIDRYCGDVIERLEYDRGTPLMKTIGALRQEVKGHKRTIVPGLSEEWQPRRLALRQNILGQDPTMFIRWATIQATMFVGDTPWIRRILESMREDKSTWRRWRSALREDEFGAPVLLPGREKWTSGNLINQARHLMSFEMLTGLQWKELPGIADFAGGYGAAAKIIRRLGHEGDYAHYDMPEMASLADFYLKGCAIEGVDTYGDLDEFMEEALPNRGLFMSWCGMSEMPISIRLRVLNTMVDRIDQFYFIFGKVFFGGDNTEFFEGFAADHPEFQWQQGMCFHTHQYMIGVRT
jgi:hypothetical protein